MLQLLTLLLEKPTDDSVEVAVNFTKECGQARFMGRALWPMADVRVYGRLVLCVARMWAMHAAEMCAH